METLTQTLVDPDIRIDPTPTERETAAMLTRILADARSRSRAHLVEIISATRPHYRIAVWRLPLNLGDLGDVPPALIYLTEGADLAADPARDLIARAEMRIVTEDGPHWIEPETYRGRYRLVIRLAPAPPRPALEFAPMALMAYASQEAAAVLRAERTQRRRVILIPPVAATGPRSHR